jgi:hypothetical protein
MPAAPQPDKLFRYPKGASGNTKQAYRIYIVHVWIYKIYLSDIRTALCEMQNRLFRHTDSIFGNAKRHVLIC